MKRLRLFKVELELVVRDPDAVIKAARKLCSSDDWKDRVSEVDGDEVFVAMDMLFHPGFVIPDKLVEAIEFYAGGSEMGESVRKNWFK